MPLQTLPPDQRAVVQLILQRERSYAQIAELLSDLRGRGAGARSRRPRGARAGRRAAADKVAQVADFLLGQQNGKPRQATRRLLRSSNGAREWAETVRASSRASAPRLPELPERRRRRPPSPRPARAEAAPEPEAAPEHEPDPSPRSRPRRPARARSATRHRAPGRAPSAPPRAPAGAVAASSRVGGAVLIGLVVIAIVAIVLWLFVFRGSRRGRRGELRARPTPTATAAQPTPMGQLALRGTGAARGASGALAVYTQQKQLLFALQVSQMPPTPAGKKYALWLSGPGNRARWIGDIPKVGKSGVLQVQGPRQSDTSLHARLRRLPAGPDHAADRHGRKRPGPTLVRGTLPRG